MHDLFRKFSWMVSQAVGSPAGFVGALSVVILWIATGPVFEWSSNWQLVINTLTTIVTFLMVFLIQNTQNRDTKAVHLKLDELIRGIKGASDELIDVESLPDDRIEKLHKHYENLHQKFESELSRRGK